MLRKYVAEGLSRELLTPTSLLGSHFEETFRAEASLVINHLLLAASTSLGCFVIAACPQTLKTEAKGINLGNPRDLGPIRNQQVNSTQIAGDLPAGVTLKQIDGGPNYYGDHGFTYAHNAGWDSPIFFPIGPFTRPRSYNVIGKTKADEVFGQAIAKTSCICRPPYRSQFAVMQHPQAFERACFPTVVAGVISAIPSSIPPGIGR
jgi:hypothetical protein